MKTFQKAAIVAIAGFGILASAQEYTNKYNAAKPGLDQLMNSMQYGEAVEKIRAIVPAEIPDFPRNPDDPRAGVTNYFEMGSLQDFHEYLYKALLMSGDVEGAIASIKKADAIAQKNAVETEAALSPTIQTWSTTVEDNTKRLEEATAVKEELLATKNQLEAKPKRKKAEDQALAAVVADLAALEPEMNVWETNLKAAPAIMQQLNGYISSAKNDAGKFAQDTEAMESDLAAEKEAINAAKFKGDKAKYVTGVLPSAKDMELREKVKFLNRLLFLAPNDNTKKAVQKQLDAALAER